jgi:hypothetical protein
VVAPCAGIGALGGAVLNALLDDAARTYLPENPGANLADAVWALVGGLLSLLVVGFCCAVVGTARRARVVAFLSGLLGYAVAHLALPRGSPSTDGAGGVLEGLSELLLFGVLMLLGYAVGALAFALMRRTR